VTTVTFIKVFQVVGSEELTWHSLRHTWATNFLKFGGNIRELQQAGGWASIRMCERYTHTDDVDIKEVLERMSSSQPKPTREKLGKDNYDDEQKLA